MITRHINPDKTTVSVRLGADVRLGDRVRLGDGVQLGDRVQLGADVWLGDRVQLGADVWLGDRVRLARQADEWVICAGCRCFTLPVARAHWTATRGGTPLGIESLRIVDYLAQYAHVGD